MLHENKNLIIPSCSQLFNFIVLIVSFIIFTVCRNQDCNKTHALPLGDTLLHLCYSVILKKPKEFPTY